MRDERHATSPSAQTPAWPDTAVWPDIAARVDAPPIVERLPDRVAARAVVGAAAAGVLAQLLFYEQTLGVNFPIWIAVVLAAAYSLRRRGGSIDRYDLWLAPTAVSFAAFVALRNDMSLLFFDVLASCALTLAAVVAMGGQPVSRSAWARIARLGGTAVALFWGGATVVARGFRPLLAAVPALNERRGAPVLRGLVIAIPLVVGFALLFAAADAVFQSLLQTVVDVRVDSAELIARSIFALIAAWLFAGTMAAASLSRERFPTDEERAAAGERVAAAVRPARLGTTETLVVLLAVDLMFAVFVAVQAAYLFPQADPLAVSGLTYSEYARRGFFELIMAAGLAGVVIVGLDAFVAVRTRAYRAAAAMLAALTGIVLVSAVVRLALYQQAYGWTELRFYALAAICWLAFGVVAAVAGLALRRVSWLPKAMVAAGFAIAVTCNLVGPQAYVTDQNIQRVVDPALVPEGGYSGLDTWYLGSLGADATQVILARLDEVTGPAGVQLRNSLRAKADEMRREAKSLAWPSWNLSRQRALEALTASGF